MKHVFSLVLTFVLISAFAQKKALEIDDFNHWMHISGQKISPHGEVLSYELNPGRGDGNLIIHRINENQNDTIQRGSGAVPSFNDKMLAFRIKPQLDKTREAKVSKDKKIKDPKDSLGIWVCGVDTLMKYPEVASFSMPDKGDFQIAFTTDEKFKTVKDTGKVETDSLLVKNDTIPSKKKKPLKGGKTLVVLNALDGDSVHFKHVSEFKWSEAGDRLWILHQFKDTIDKTMLTLWDNAKKESKALFMKPGVAKKLTINKKGDKMIFFFSEDTVKEKIYNIYGVLDNKVQPQLIVDTTQTFAYDHFVPSTQGSCFFSEDDQKLYFGTAPAPVKDPEDSLLADEKAVLDIWSWTDTLIQPMQKVNVSKEINRTYTAVLHLKNNRLVQLETPDMKDLSLPFKGSGDRALGYDATPYERASGWSGKWIKDVYSLDVKTGERELIVRGVSSVRLSRNELFALYYDWRDSAYHAINLKKGGDVNLTKTLDVAFYNELNDVPNDPGAYGVAGWSEKDAYCFIYDRYDIWKIDPRGQEMPVRLTKGREKKFIYRIRILDSEQRFLSMEEPQLVTVFSESDKKSGFAKLRLDGASALEAVIMKDAQFGTVMKAKEANKMMYSYQSCEAYPDICISDLFDFDCRKVSNANPQQSDYIWAKVELVQWTDLNGEKREGLLYKPEDFDPAKKYPMLLYFYERNSDNLHRHSTPSPSRSIINKTFYPSNGYLVFVPDIVYKNGYPGESAYNCIMSGVNYLMDKHAYIDAKKIGIQGQSWGGYQSAYLITRTNLFAAAMAGAPVSNMTSAYGGIRWDSGMSRMFQYEHTQSRIGGTLWEKPLLYIENSPLFYADKVQTPLLIMHNDKDGAVPWYQGIEYFMALRRLDKPVWMLSYNNEPHNLKSTSWGNRMDLSTRMKQFFDHYLKDEEAPEWMMNGRRAVDKNRTLAY